jgi:electron transfer flavoprotein alpha subunit
MAINNVWVFAQVSNGAPTTGTLELLTKARSLTGNVTAILGGDAASVAGVLGEYGATKVYATGDLAGKLPGVAVAAAMKAVIDGGETPDLVLFPQNYEGRDVMSRLSVKLDKTVLTNSVDVVVDGDTVAATTPIIGGNTLVRLRTSSPSARRASLPNPLAAQQLRSLPQRFLTRVQPVPPR